MKVEFDTAAIQKLCSDQKAAVRALGRPAAVALGKRLVELAAAESLADISHLPPQNRHQLSGFSAPHFALRVHGGMRLVVRVGDSPLPVRADGTSVDLVRVRHVIVTFVGDYHGY